MIDAFELLSVRNCAFARTPASAPLFSFHKLPCFALLYTFIHRIKLYIYFRSNIDGKIVEIASVEYVCVCVGCCY